MEPDDSGIKWGLPATALRTDGTPDEFGALRMALNASAASTPVSVTLASGTVGVLEEGRDSNAKGLSLQIDDAISPLVVLLLVELPIPNEIPTEVLAVLRRPCD